MVSHCMSDGPPESAIYGTQVSGAQVAEGGGGAFAALNGGHVELTDTTIADCDAGNLGASLLAFGSATAVLTRVTTNRTWAGVAGSVSSVKGSSIALDASTLSFGTFGFTSGMYADSSYGTDTGPGLWAHTGASLYVTGTVIRNMTAKYYGGCAYARSGAILEMTDSKCLGTYAGRHIGSVGVVLSRGKFTNIEISDCAAVGLASGIMYALHSHVPARTAGARLHSLRTALLFRSHHASPFLRIDNAIFRRNKAGSEGGALRIAYPADCDIRNVLIEDCEADKGGGIALSTGATCKFENIRVMKSKAREGGGVFVAGAKPEKFEKVVIDGCEATELGGGMYVGPASEVSFQVKIMNSKATGQGLGGGLAVAGGTAKMLTGSSISDCSASQGGLIAVSGTLSLSLSCARALSLALSLSPLCALTECNLRSFT